MTKLSSISDLTRVLGDVVGFEDPMGELKRRGFNVTGDLEKALREVKPSGQLSVAKRKQFAAIAGKGTVTFRIGPPLVPELLKFAPNDYDVIAGIRLSLADQVLNGLRETQTIPQLVPLLRLLSAKDHSDLLSALRDVFATIPADARIGDLTIRPGISTTALNGTDQIQLNVPVSLDIFHVVNVDGVDRRETLGPLSGRLRLVARLGADVTELNSDAALTISATLPPLGGGAVPQLEVDAASRLQPNLPGKLPLLALKLQFGLSKLIGPSFQISPFINLPGVPGIQLVIEHIDVRSVSAPDGDLIMVGVRFIGVGVTQPDPARLSRLRPDAGRNIVLRVHERYLKVVFETARTNRVLDKIAQKEKAGVRITSTNVKFSPGEIKIFLGGVDPDACGPLDVSFSVVATLRLALKGDAVQIETSTEVSVSSADLIVCAILATVALALVFPSLMALPFLGIVTVLLTDLDLLDLPSGSQSVTLLPLNSPVPRTQLLPVLDQLTSRVSDGEMISSAAATLKADDISTFIYVRVFHERVIVKSPQAIALTQGVSIETADFTVPLAGALVQVCDQDTPAPAGDDVVPQKNITEKIVTPKFIIKESITYERPTRDQVLGQAKTDFDGRVMFTLRPGAGRGAGFEVFRKTTQDIHSHEVETESSRTRVEEKAPDIFFLFKSQSASADSRNLPGGFMLNLRSKKLGTPTAPLKFTVGL